MGDIKKDIKVAVLMGGISNEREISLQSGSMIASALNEAGTEVVSFDIAPDRLGILDDESIDVFFLALHGEFGEDGKLQKILEDRGLCFAGSGSAASKIAIDKAACKEAVQRTGVTLPLHITVKLTDDAESLSKEIMHLGERVVIKPVTHGSSFGVRIVNNTAEAAKTAFETYEKFGSCMIEQFVEGREITVGVLNGKTLPIIEIRSKRGFYDFDAKYTDQDTEYLFDTIEDKDAVDKINTLALECFNAVGCRHWGRVDLILSEEGTAYFLEINTLPGFTSHSLVPMAANKAGLSNGQLCLEIAKSALEDKI
ncbi:MAG: D-alanine--D-alanine ligase [Planctomycetes bacterium]|nr:D-alanine--D-alanine ligase [Planctomycetota bacterium]